MLSLPVLRTLNTLIALPYLYIHAILVIVLATTPKHYDVRAPEVVDMAGWGWWGWMLLNVFILAFVVLQYNPRTTRFHRDKIRTQFALLMVYEMGMALCWRTHAYPAALIFSLLSTISLASLYYSLHFSADARPCEDGVELVGGWLVISAWLPWSLYLCLFTLFQALPALQKHHHHRSSIIIEPEWVANLGLALLVTTSILLSLRLRRRRPAGDPLGTFFLTWILWALFAHRAFTLDHAGPKRPKDRLGLAWAGTMAGVSSLAFGWACWTSYEATEASRFVGFGREDEGVSWERSERERERTRETVVEPEVDGERTRLLSV